MNLPMPRPLRAALACVAGLACAAGLIACGGDDTAATSSESTASTGYPFTYTDCGGTPQTVTKAPERVVAMDIDAYYLLRDIGFADRIVALGWVLQDPPKGVPHIGEFGEYPSKDEVLAQRPDLAVSPYSSAFGPKGAFPQPQLVRLGVATYYALSGCGSTGELRDLRAVTADVTNLGGIFGRPEVADAVVERFEDGLATAQADPPADPADRPTVWIYEGTDGPAAYGRNTVPNAVIWLAGGRNVFDDTIDYNNVSSEAVLKRDPDVIWLMPDAGFGGIGDGPGAADRMRAKLEKHPVLGTLTAVREGRFAVVDYSTGSQANLKNPEAVGILAAEIAKVGGAR